MAAFGATLLPVINVFRTTTEDIQILLIFQNIFDI